MTANSNIKLQNLKKQLCKLVEKNPESPTTNPERLLV
jgi:hypothetical protein